ncbi:circadian clock protein KaiB [Massilia sp. UYP11]|uniref:circadian clock KaiB family protein n=1 Tax=Massilia sp. UYP11 TaxID=1756385 RepID=UPI003D236AEE
MSDPIPYKTVACDDIPSRPGVEYILELYVSGTTSKSMQAIVNIERVCKQYLAGRVNLSVIDIYQNPQRARDAQIIAVPTLVRIAPLPTRRAVGAMSDDAKVLLMLDLYGD